ALTTFWSKPFPPLRFQQIVDRLRSLSGRSGQKYAAWFLARSGAQAAHMAGDPRAEAPACAHLVVAAQGIGEETGARANLDISDRLFPKIPAAYRLEPQISIARMELEIGHVDEALRRLETLRGDIEPAPSVLIETRYYSVLGEAHRLKGEFEAARG